MAGMTELEPGNPDELCETLTNWLNRANGPLGSLPAGTTPVEWAVRNFIASWRDPIRDALDSIDESLDGALAALSAGNPQEAKFHLECIRQALSGDIRTELGLQPWNK